MDVSTLTGTLADLAIACLDEEERDQLLARALPLLAASTGAGWAAVVARGDTGPRVLASHGQVPDLSGETDALPAQGWVDLDVPVTWSSTGTRRVGGCRLPAPGESLLVGWPGEPADDHTAAVAVLVSALQRVEAEERLADLVARVDSAQQLANMGDYDWHISSDTNRWSDQLYRIYGHDPGSFNPSYERFLSLIHPEDRERISAVHQEAYATGEPYQMIERIVRPDGETRYLSSNGQVIQDESGTPVRMRGTCIDITDRVLAEQQRERSAARFRALVETSPDAIVVVDGAGTVLQTNAHAEELVGPDLLERRLPDLVPQSAVLHGGAAVAATAVDGRALTLDIASAELDDALGERLRAVFLHDAGPRLQREALAASLREADVRRRQALEINDNIVQGLTAAVYSMEAGLPSRSQGYLESTLAAARRMMNDLLDPLDGEDLQPGDLVRSQPSTLGEEVTAPAGQTATATAPAPDGTGCRVLVVDDYDDVRMLLRIKLESLGHEVVAEAADGQEAVALATSHQPDLVLLDVAMPLMDGLQALPLILQAVDGVRVVVLSGFDQGAMAEKALAAGAARYVEKGHALAELVKVLDDICER